MAILTLSPFVLGDIDVEIEPGNSSGIINVPISHNNDTAQLVDVNVYLPYFDTELTPSGHFWIDNGTTKNVELEIFVPDGYYAGNKYNGTFYVYFDYDTESIPIEVTVPQHKNITVDFPNNITLYSGQEGYIEGVVHSNSNCNLDLNFTNDFELFNNTNITAFMQRDNKLYVEYSIPADFKPDDYQATFFVSGSGTNFTKGINYTHLFSANVSIEDNTTPELNVTHIDNISVGKPFTILAISTDNYIVNQVYAEMNCADNDRTINFTKVGNEWRGEVEKFQEPVSCIITTTAEDTSGNTEEYSMQTDIIYTKNFKLYNEIDLQKFREDKERQVRLLESEDPINFSIVLNDMNFVDTASNSFNYSQNKVTFWVESSDRKIKFDELNQEVKFSGVNELLLNTMVKNRGTLAAEFTVELPVGLTSNTTQRVFVEGQASDYTVYEPRDREALGYDIHIETYDGGSAGESFTMIQYNTSKGDVQNPDRMVVFHDITSLEQKEANYTARVNTAEADRDSAKLLFALTLMFCVILVLVLVYFVKFREVVNR